MWGLQGLLVPWASVVPIHGSPEVVKGADSTCSVKAGVFTSMHYCGGLHCPPMTLGCGGSPLAVCDY